MSPRTPKQPDSRTGWDGRTGRSSRTASGFVWAHTVSKTIKKGGETTWGRGDRGDGDGPTSDVLLHVGAGRRGRT